MHLSDKTVGLPEGALVGETGGFLAGGPALPSAGRFLPDTPFFSDGWTDKSNFTCIMYIAQHPQKK